MKTALKGIIGVAACAAAAVTAYAAVTFDAATGTGFVGKGDVQLALGWNNKILQTPGMGSEVSFTYDTSTSYDVTCEWTTGPDKNPTKHTQTKTESRGVVSGVTYDARVKNQITGYNLKGLDNVVIEGGGDIPKVGDACPGVQGNGKSVTAVVLLEGDSTGGLFVTHGTRRELIYSAVQ